ncbi:hypothetical protein D3C72_1265820 [compost metagenome]
MVRAGGPPARGSFRRGKACTRSLVMCAAALILGAKYDRLIAPAPRESYRKFQAGNGLQPVCNAGILAPPATHAVPCTPRPNPWPPPLHPPLLTLRPPRRASLPRCISPPSCATGSSRPCSAAAARMSWCARWPRSALRRTWRGNWWRPSPACCARGCRCRRAASRWRAPPRPRRPPNPGCRARRCCTAATATYPCCPAPSAPWWPCSKACSVMRSAMH